MNDSVSLSKGSSAPKKVSNSSPSEGPSEDKVLGGIPALGTQETWNKELDPAKRKRAPDAAGF